MLLTGGAKSLAILAGALVGVAAANNQIQSRVVDEMRTVGGKQLW